MARQIKHTRISCKGKIFAAGASTRVIYKVQGGVLHGWHFHEIKEIDKTAVWYDPGKDYSFWYLSVDNRNLRIIKYMKGLYGVKRVLKHGYLGRKKKLW